MVNVSHSNSICPDIDRWVKYTLQGTSDPLAIFLCYFCSTDSVCLSSLSFPSVDVDPDLDMDSQDYLEALVQATGELEFCVNLCKSRVMMETCFDIVVATTGAQGGHQEVEV